MTNSDSEALFLGAQPKSNWIYLWEDPSMPSGVRYIDITSQQHAWEDQVGDGVYKSGRNGFSVGNIVSIDAAIYWQQAGIVTTNARLASYESDPGDSGGSVAWGHTAMGIHEGSTGGGLAVYTHIDYAIQNLGIWVNLVP